MPRILLLHATVGTGHKRAAEALQVAFERRQPGEVRVEDVLDYAPPLFQQAYAKSYLDITNKAPLVWGYFYHQTEVDPTVSEFVNNIRKLVEGVSVIQLKDVLRSFQPDAIICTHFLPVEMLLSLKNKGELQQPVYCVVTDYSAHTFWANPGLDGYFVGAEHTRDQLIARGIHESAIRITGIPIDPTVAEPKDPADMRQAHGFTKPGPLITLFGGGIETSHVREIVEDLLATDIEGTLVVVAGRNEQLATALNDLQSSPRLELQVLGLIDYVDDLIVASDLIITKSGGLIVSEVLARNVPMLVIDPIPGQEEWNADYVVSSGAGIQLRMTYMVAKAVKRLLAQPEMLKAMRANSAMIARPRAASTVVDYVLADLE
jgi:processive 1,2-diacylglycerol beta-glucosyltransferase